MGDDPVRKPPVAPGGIQKNAELPDDFFGDAKPEAPAAQPAQQVPPPAPAQAPAQPQVPAQQPPSAAAPSQPQAPQRPQPTAAPATPSQPQTAGQGVRCNHCGHNQTSGSKLCDACGVRIDSPGSRFTDEDAAPPPLPELNTINLGEDDGDAWVLCGDCGTPNRPGKRACHACGNPLVQRELL